MSKRIKNNSKKKNVQVGRESRSFFFLFIIFLLMFFLINWLAKIPKNNQDKISTIEASDTDTIPKKLNENMVKVNTISFEKDSYEYIVYECAKKLEIPDKLFRLKVKDNIVNINLPINPNRLDLNFANYLISKELLDKKWILISGEESASERSQKLTFNTPDLGKQFVINIYYDNSKSYPVERPKIALVITELGDKEFSEISNYLNIPYKLNFAIIP